MTDTPPPLTMPNGIILVDQGHTGNILEKDRRSHSPEAVLKVLKERTSNREIYPEYKKSIWDCEDFAFLAASEVRCFFPGQPVGILVGEAVNIPKIKAGEIHAINVLWFEKDEGGRKTWYSEYFDATTSSRLEPGCIKTEMIIALPILASQDEALHTRIEPFNDNNHPFLPTAAFELDTEYNMDKNEMDKVIQTLQKKNSIERCPKSMNNPWWTPNDKAFWWFSHIRKIHMGVPVGVAFGFAVDRQSHEKFEYCSLVVWDRDDNCRYWDIDARDYSDSDRLQFDFTPRIIIV
ncbi:MAG: hypothetical protein PHQ34_12500 [Methanothrix sp.]|nr:hypothetical protein [Methanothrix sp.]